MRGKSYLSIGGMAMGIAGSLVDQDLLQSYLGMRTEVIDMCEIERRIAEEIYDPEEYTRAIAWVRENCIQAEDTVNTPEFRRSEEQLKKDWEYCTKMTMIGRDLMIGNKKLEKLGFRKRFSANALFSFQASGSGPTMAERRLHGNHAHHQLRLNGIREPYII